MAIKFFDVREQYLDNQHTIDTGVNIALATGKYFSDLEHTDLAKMISFRYNDAPVTLTNSGTSALITALTALDLRKGSYVLMPTMTYAATAQAVLAVGCQPEFVDIDEHYLMDTKELKKSFDRFRPNISAVIAVDLYGQGSNIDELLPFCRDRKIPLVIDAAQSFGMTSMGYDQTMADAVCLSFNPLKNWGGIGGGAVVSKKINPNKLRAITHCGKDEHGELRYHGGNYRMDSIQAAILNQKMEYCWDMDVRKLYIDNVYREAFSDIMPRLTPWNKNRRPYVSVIAPQDAAKVRKALSAANIEYRSHYDRPLHMESLFRRRSESLPVAESLAGRLISLPNNYHITDDDVYQVIDVVKSAL
jgi:UDP-2-acetamido-2-deoxy-ribo-hexuluronate aminotransferase